MALIGEDDIFPPSEITILLQCVFCLKKQKPYEYHAEHIRSHVWDISHSVQVRYSDCLTYTYKTFMFHTQNKIMKPVRFLSLHLKSILPKLETIIDIM